MTVGCQKISNCTTDIVFIFWFESCVFSQCKHDQAIFCPLVALFAALFKTDNTTTTNWCWYNISGLDIIAQCIYNSRQFISECTFSAAFFTLPLVFSFIASNKTNWFSDLLSSTPLFLEQFFFLPNPTKFLSNPSLPKWLWNSSPILLKF